MDFTQLALSPLLLRALETEGYQTPTPIQAKAIPLVMAGGDVLGCAQTGTGKTAAFALPLLHRLIEEPAERLRNGGKLARVLILAPTRELAVQIADSFKTYGKQTSVTGTIIYGGVGQGPQVRVLKRGVDVFVAKPGRLIDLMEQGYVDLSNIQTLVLDEADRMLDMGFINPIRRIAAETPKERQTLLFSATMSPEIRSLAQTLLKSPTQIAVDPVASAAPKIVQSLYLCNRHDKQSLLNHMLKDPAYSRVLVFTKTKHGADRVGEKLEKAGISCETIHGNKAQNARTRALNAFRGGKARVLVATDVAARGLDVDNITHVFNFDLPMEPEAYIHRIGRTGRAGMTGMAVAFCDPSERALLRDVERLLKNRIPQSPLPDFERAPREFRADTRPMTPGGGTGRGAPGAGVRTASNVGMIREIVEVRPAPRQATPEHAHPAGHDSDRPTHHHHAERSAKAKPGKPGKPVPTSKPHGGSHGGPITKNTPYRAAVRPTRRSGPR